MSLDQLQGFPSYSRFSRHRRSSLGIGIFGPFLAGRPWCWSRHPLGRACALDFALSSNFPGSLSPSWPAVSSSFTCRKVSVSSSVSIGCRHRVIKIRLCNLLACTSTKPIVLRCLSRVLRSNASDVTDVLPVDHEAVCCNRVLDPQEACLNMALLAKPRCSQTLSHSHCMTRPVRCSMCHSKELAFAHFETK